jgi:hypothetical protein
METFGVGRRTDGGTEGRGEEEPERPWQRKGETGGGQEEDREEDTEDEREGGREVVALRARRLWSFSQARWNNRMKGTARTRPIGRGAAAEPIRR